MRAVSIENLEPGAILAKTIYSPDGRVLLRKGSELVAKTIATLARLGYQYIYIADALTADIEAPELLDDELRNQATQSVRTAFEEAIKVSSDPKAIARGINMDGISNVAGDLVEQILSNSDLSIQIVDLKSYDQYTFQHSVNVAVLGVVLGKSIRMNFGELKDLAIGCLLHDLGNVTIPETILKKPTKLTDDEFKYIYEHPRSGFELLRHCDRISATSKIVALQHHERLNGTGYPKGLKGPDIHINSQVAAIVDAYDALTSDRNYRKRYLPHEAIEYLMAAGDTHFSFQLVKNFTELVAPYPPGTIVQLSSGDVGVVVKVDMATSARPLLRLMRDGSGKEMPHDELDLTAYPTLVISKVLEA